MLNVVYFLRSNTNLTFLNLGPNITASTESAEFSDPEVEPDILPQHMRKLQYWENRTYLTASIVYFISGSFYRDPDTNLGSDTTTLQENQGWEIPLNDYSDVFNLFQTPPQVQERHVLIKARLHLIISALISALLAIFWRENHFSIFIPAGLCVITDLLFFREQKPLHPILNMIFMMFSSRLPPQAKNCLHIFAIVQSIIVDLGVFIFSFCTLFYLLLICTNNYITELMVIQ